MLNLQHEQRKSAEDEPRIFRRDLRYVPLIAPVMTPTYLQKVLASFLGDVRAHKITHVTSHAFGWASAITVPIIIGMTVVMLRQAPPIDKVQIKNLPEVQYVPGMDIYPPMRIEMHVQRAVFTYTLNDGQGHAVYTWPKQVVDDPKYVFGDTALMVPSSLRLAPGDYYVHAHVDYMYNPISRSSLSGNIAHLLVR